MLCRFCFDISMRSAVALCAGDEALWSLAGVPVVSHAARALRDVADPVLIVVAGTPAAGAAVTAEFPDRPVLVEPGPLAALCRLHALAAADVDVVLLHDAIRALTPAALIGQVVAAVRAGTSAVAPLLPEHNTVKSVAEDGRVLSTVDRDMLRTVQSPYGFPRRSLDLLAGGLAEHCAPDALAWLLGGGQLQALPGHPDGFAIDAAPARRLAERVLRNRLAVA